VNEIAHIALGIALGALGNAAWGQDGGRRWQAIILVSCGCVVANPQFAPWLPLIGLLYWLFRFQGTGASWLAFHTGRNRMKAILRGWPLLPFAAFFTLIDHKDVHMILAFGFPVLAYFYYLSWKLAPKICTAISELLVGAYLVAVAADWTGCQVV